MVSSLHLADILALSAAGFITFHLSSRKPPLSRPPGPPGYPVIGNLFDIPKELPWIQFAKWAKEYGDVISLSVFGQTIVILNSHYAVKDVVLTRPLNFAGRPSIKFAEMRAPLPIRFTTVGREWRERRRIIDAYFRPAAIQPYKGVQIEKVVKLLRRIIDKPDDISDHTREYSGALIMDIVYGYDVKNRGDYFVRINEEFQSFASRTVLPNGPIVNAIPILGRLPPWMLGKEFAALLEKGTRLWKQVLHEPFEWTKNSIKTGTAKESLIRTSLSEISEGDTEGETVLEDAFGNIFAEDMVPDRPNLLQVTATLRAFILHMVLNPAVQVEAQKELDRVVGRERVPDFDDRPNLPYVDAVLMEVLRWAPTTPLGVPHSAEEDVNLERFRIPKGSIVLGNAWAILHDQTYYPEPDAFKPERHLGTDGHVLEDPILDYAFGYGTRRCPGRHFADATLWLYVASVLAFFNIRKAKDENGNEIPVDGKYEPTNLIHQPLPFSCTLVPRDRNILERVFQKD
ncbi:cytochrome P450 [Vararia minispora EC-137]|uniref:Cytochrome P450 n=1 Tax=Vararia minispora EC-137 TaxID=1314806 RepID=A0ACB8QND6_9AGAM|nr:cytochrome P450 [Vararia minispora EC-137]